MMGRFWSVDPLTSKFAYYTPYQYAGNMPIVAVDLDGLEPLIHPTQMKEITKPQLGTTNQGLRFEVYKAKDNLDDTYQIARIRNPHQNATGPFGRVFRGTDYYFYFDPNKINTDKAFGLDNTHSLLRSVSSLALWASQARCGNATNFHACLFSVIRFGY